MHFGMLWQVGTIIHWFLYLSLDSSPEHIIIGADIDVLYLHHPKYEDSLLILIFSFHHVKQEVESERHVFLAFVSKKRTTNDMHF